MKNALYVSVLVLATLAVLGTSGYASGQTPAETVVVVSRHYPAPGREDELQTRFMKIVELVRNAEPKTVYRLHKSLKEPGDVSLL